MPFTTQFTVQDVILRMSDWLANYNTGQDTTSAKIRAVDHSVNYIKRLLGFPQDESKTTFWYDTATQFYPLPTDFQDPLGLFYDSSKNNFANRGNRWDYRPYQELMVRTGQYPSGPNYWSITTVNGSNQIMLLGNNVQAGGTLDTLSSVNNWVVADGASALAVDSNNYPSNFNVQGSSLTFTGAAFGTNPVSSISNSSVIYSIPNLVAKNVFIKDYVMCTSANVTSYTLKLYTDNSNYYTFTTTTDYLGATFAASTWQKIQWSGSQATITGTPNSLQITKAVISANVNASFAGGTFWVNTLAYSYPDLMDLYYSSKNKGTNLAGATITQYTALTDSILYDFDFIEPIALRAAFYLMPSLRADPQYMSVYKSEFTEFIRLYSRSHPKTRIRNDALRTRLSR